MAALEVVAAMPADRNDAALCSPGLCAAVAAGKILPHVIKTAERRQLSACILDDVEFVILAAHPCGFLLACNDMLAVGITEKCIERLCFLG